MIGSQQWVMNALARERPKSYVMPSESYRKYNKPTVLSGIEVHRAWLSESLVASHELNTIQYLRRAWRQSRSINKSLPLPCTESITRLTKWSGRAAQLPRWSLRKGKPSGQLSLILLEMMPSRFSSPVLTVFSITFGFPFCRKQFLKPKIVAQEHLSLHAPKPIHHSDTPPEKLSGMRTGRRDPRHR